MPWNWKITRPDTAPHATDLTPHTQDTRCVADAPAIGPTRILVEVLRPSIHLLFKDVNKKCKYALSHKNNICCDMQTILSKIGSIFVGKPPPSSPPRTSWRPGEPGEPQSRRAAESESPRAGGDDSGRLTPLFPKRSNSLVRGWPLCAAISLFFRVSLMGVPSSRRLIGPFVGSSTALSNCDRHCDERRSCALNQNTFLDSDLHPLSMHESPKH